MKTALPSRPHAAIRAGPPAAGPAARLAVGLALLLAAALVPRPASAQYVWGQVLDAENGRPVSSAEVVVWNNRREVVGTAISSADGRFSIALEHLGFHYITVERLGYGDHEPVAFFLSRKEDMALDVKIRADAIELPGLQVSLTALLPHLEAGGFYHRRIRRPGGVFLERDDFEKFGPTRSSEILRRVAGVRIVRQEAGRVGEPVMRGGTGMDGSCHPGVVLDGFYVRRSGGWGAPIPFDDLVVPSQIEAIEVYRGPATIPPQWRRQSSCGLVVVWTRRG